MGHGRLEWTQRPSPDKPWYVVDYVFVLRTGDDVDVEHDHHVCGVFPRALWLRLLEEGASRPTPSLIA
jgi:hypothetical protein